VYGTGNLWCAKKQNEISPNIVYSESAEGSELVYTATFVTMATFVAKQTTTADCLLSGTVLQVQEFRVYDTTSRFQ